MVLALVVVGYARCTGGDDTDIRFARVDAEATGVAFVNAIETSDTFNILKYEYIYNGGGVGVGDFDGNGLPDLVLSGNRVTSRLYLQREPWRFEDVTAESGLTTELWCAGVNVADFDGDGRDDIFFATLDITGARTAPNLLFLQDGPTDAMPHFVEAAAAFGLDDRSYSTHSAWLDLENDGDLDLYLLNNAIEDAARNTPRGTDTSGRGASVDVVYRNRGRGRTPPFERTAFAKTEGWGLGVAVHDFNRDGFADVYVANDFLSDDLLLLNDGGTGFRESGRALLPHTSYNAMGVDVADLDGDGLAEVVTVDMLPDDNPRRKMMFADVPFQSERATAERGYTRQYVRNALQRANPDGTFSEVGYQAGVAATDWSWGPLLADFDNDGDRDLYITNGYPKDITNQDFVAYNTMATQFGTREAQMAKAAAALDMVTGVHQPNYFFRNDGELAFTDVSDKWQASEPTYSNGAVYVDLDRDGDLDLVTNNINEPAGLYRNLTRERDTSGAHYVQVRLSGSAPNEGGVGARVTVHAGDLRSVRDYYRQRGYLSTQDRVMHFGLGRHRRIDSLWVEWPSGTVSALGNLRADQLLDVREADVRPGARTPSTVTPVPQLSPVAVAGAPVHRESTASEFDLSATALRDHSKPGPALAVMPAATGEESIVVGGGDGQPTRVFRLRESAYSLTQTLPGSEAGETTALLPIDVDGDGDMDLYEGMGSTEFVGRERLLADRFYRNDGGTFVRADEVLPQGLPPGVTSRLVGGDVDGDGDTDIVLGAGPVPARFPESGASYVLHNVGGRLDIGQVLDLGAVAGLVLADLDGDSDLELAAAAELRPVTVYHDLGGAPGAIGDTATAIGEAGWWYSLSAADLDGDGDVDLLAGNIGDNGPLQASDAAPLRVIAADLDGNGAIDPVVTTFDGGGGAYPVHPRNALTRQVPALRRLVPQFRDYASWTHEDILAQAEDPTVYTVTELGSVYYENDGLGGFVPRRLPRAAQDAPLRASIPWHTAEDRPALLCVQNDYAVEPLGGRLDAGTGFLLSVESGGELVVDRDYWLARGDSRAVTQVGDAVVVGYNGETVATYRSNSARDLVR